MNQYILLIYEKSIAEAPVGLAYDWENYFHRLRASGRFDGGRAIGAGACFSKDRSTGPVTPHLVGFIRVRANSLEEASHFLLGNPVYEAGGTVEIRELPSEE